jgi:hypothetical protein
MRAELGLRPFAGGSVRHTDWDELEAPVRHAIEARTSRVRAVRTVNAGLNSQLAVVLDTDAGWVFVKGLRVDHPEVVRQGREAMINPYVHAVAPRLQWTSKPRAGICWPSSTSTAGSIASRGW